MTLETASNKRPILILMTKLAVEGHCKTRLAANIGPKNAARIQGELTKHTIAVAQSLAKRWLVEVHLAISGISSKEGQKWGLNQGLKNVFHQGEGDLGLRMKRQILQSHKKLTTKNSINRTTLLIGTDLPTLCQLDLIKAIKELESNEMVLGPALDGGYWLLGLSEQLVNPLVSWPFDSIAWGTNQVLRQTISKAKEKDIRYALLREQNDVDHLNDLSPWQG
ncbi:TIGR04282 family arsenosugar biosynthesis glycosyltransferase [Prochlorococcus sp. MIT 1307]|uniref:TIGR04282 family arsenosugar biosynthesis glycosyltransferase n=1 Tax=Prochlorococcus sp. MIT 1307 TaxID=3096219 RepID=UPI002A75AF0F|nr:TIGR04282 family arsenosugar biosynthesis glycosyltransferase [Prochlorococcus sp. MIT 1307]